MPLLPRALPAGFIAPCLPTSSPQPPSGDVWLHEIRKENKRVKLYSRPGNDITYRFPLIVEAFAKLRPRSCIMARRWRAAMTASRCSTAFVTGGTTPACSSTRST